MATWAKEEIELKDGTKVAAQMPVIVSASRSTDIPAFYSDWFMERLKAGYIKWFNPFNGVPLYVGFKKIRCIVFWSKNPAPMIPHLDELDKICPNYYFQFTLNDYNAAHVSRKTYSAIAGNELRPVSKAVATQFALALQLTRTEADEFLKAAGYAFSPAILEDIIVCACIEEKVYDIADVNSLLLEYSAKPFATKEDT